MKHTFYQRGVYRSLVLLVLRSTFLHLCYLDLVFVVVVFCIRKTVLLKYLYQNSTHARLKKMKNSPNHDCRPVNPQSWSLADRFVESFATHIPSPFFSTWRVSNNLHTGTPILRRWNLNKHLLHSFRIVLAQFHKRRTNTRSQRQRHSTWDDGSMTWRNTSIAKIQHGSWLNDPPQHQTFCQWSIRHKNHCEHEYFLVFRPPTTIQQEISWVPRSGTIRHCSEMLADDAPN